MEVSISSYSNTKPVFFAVHVSIQGHTSYVIRKRYSEFATFAEDIEKEMGEPTPVSLPEKKWIGNNNEDFLKERRRRLELFLRNLVKQEEWRESLALQKFLDLSKHLRSDSRSKDNLQTASAWAKAVSEVRTMIQQIKETSGSPSGTAEERRLHVKAKSKLQELEGSLIGDNSLGEGEYMRRRNIVQDLSRALYQTEGRRHSVMMSMNNGGSSSQPTIPGSLVSNFTENVFFSFERKKFFFSFYY